MGLILKCQDCNIVNVKHQWPHLHSSCKLKERETTQSLWGEILWPKQYKFLWRFSKHLLMRRAVQMKLIIDLSPLILSISKNQEQASTYVGILAGCMQRWINSLSDNMLDMTQLIVRGFHLLASSQAQKTHTMSPLNKQQNWHTCSHKSAHTINTEAPSDTSCWTFFPSVLLSSLTTRSWRPL